MKVKLSCLFYVNYYFIHSFYPTNIFDYSGCFMQCFQYEGYNSKPYAHRVLAVKTLTSSGKHIGRQLNITWWD